MPKVQRAENRVNSAMVTRGCLYLYLIRYRDVHMPSLQWHRVCCVSEWTSGERI